MKNFLKNNSLFLLIVLLAIALRFAGIEKVPPALNWDEISHGYNAYSILKTGKDEWGATLPTIFRAYGDYKLPVYIYLTALSEAIFGLTALAVRLPGVLAGIVTVVFTYFLARKLFNPKVALLSSLLVAIEPWSLFLSRGAFEANLALALILPGFYFFLKGLKESKYLVLATFLLGLSVWTYNSARIFVPLMIAATKILYWKDLRVLWKKAKVHLFFTSAIAIIFFVPMFWQLIGPAGQARYGKVAIIDEGAIAQINERIIYNKGTYFGSRFVKNYFSHFSLDFLASRGGTHYQFSLPGHGLVYGVNIVFFLVGLIWLLKSRKKESFFVLAWLLLSPIPSSLTREAPHVLRAITMLPVPMLITAIGFSSFLDWARKRKFSQKVATIIYLVVLFLFTEGYLTQYFENYPKDYSWSWQYGYQDVVSYAKEVYGDYDKIVVTKKYGEPHEFLLFFWPWEPEMYRNDPNLIRFEQSGWFWVDKFDKFYFVNDWEIPKEKGVFVLESKKEVVDCTGKIKCLLITSPGNYPVGWEKLKTINFLDGTGAFEIYEN
ncbi:MAG: hypothetical protein UX03_C0042G0004 [Candidatus Woesebacteria bacterium GW2011_GWE1_45_18]|uniref:Glycosyltransferase RgtA/B/C/D-like domain-containing protein n=1 Tax=Candidatus Woesebacteria bacterium GW2011_GWE1_45_18 TaxID=1618598 RepID=A0A0G1M004_9BACT|nr:MAG: hypothetical protein UX03_C0042G0004 [Candidatus Woesebacteria bacterium GW2011_GWE1_45_18]